MATQTLKGFRDFLPQTMAVRNKVIDTVKEVFSFYGFWELQTPTLEYSQVLLGKYGEEAEKLMYLFKDRGGRNVGLKYDLTVPLARVMSQYPKLPIPFKRFQIQPVFRADKPQKGRYREFYQCDVDTVGSSSPLSDAEILTVISECLIALGFPNFSLKINSRDILFSLLEKASVDKKLAISVLQSLDKLDKKPQAEVEAELSQKSLSPDQVKTLFRGISQALPDENLTDIISLSKKLGAKNIVFTPTLVRGLDYYTGAIFETTVTQPKIGSITGGGRFDNLIKTLGGPNLPAVGTSLGLDRISDVIEENKLLENLPSKIQILVTVFDGSSLSTSASTAKSLREKGIACEVYPDTSKLEKQLQYSTLKNIPYVVIIGPEESKAGLVTLKDMAKFSQITLSLDQLIQNFSHPPAKSVTPRKLQTSQ